MLIKQSQFVPPEIERMIKEIQTEDSRFDRELRSAHREKIVLPVTIKSLDGKELIECTSRNISSTGICLLSTTKFESDTQWLLQINRLNEKTSEVMATCKWSREFGRAHSISGWQFIRMTRNS
jgi:hypothetical protein